MTMARWESFKKGNDPDEGKGAITDDEIADMLLSANPPLDSSLEDLIHRLPDKMVPKPLLRRLVELAMAEGAKRAEQGKGRGE